MKELGILIARRIQHRVNGCFDCPYFDRHPQENSCSHPAVDTSVDSFAGMRIIDDKYRHGFPVLCPFKNTETK